MMGIDVMCKGLHFGECRRLPLLTHNVFNAFGESGIVAVLEDTFIPASVDSEMVEFNVIFWLSCILRLSILSSASAVGSTGPN